MLRQLSIHNVVLVDRLELEFEPGLGVLTGETGAGKSILLDALGLALGARADAGLVRAGQQSASVSAEIELAAAHPAIALLEEQGLPVEPGEALIVRRILITRIYEGQGFRRTTRERPLTLRVPVPGGGVLSPPGPAVDVVSLAERQRSTRSA